MTHQRASQTDAVLHSPEPRDYSLLTHAGVLHTPKRVGRRQDHDPVPGPKELAGAEDSRLHIQNKWYRGHFCLHTRELQEAQYLPKHPVQSCDSTVPSEPVPNEHKLSLKDLARLKKWIG